MAENNVMVLKFPISGPRTIFMVQHFAWNKIRDWNSLREKAGKNALKGVLALHYEIAVPYKEDISLFVEFNVQQNGHDADYYAEALGELGKIFAEHYRLPKPPVITGYPEN